MNKIKNGIKIIRFSCIQDKNQNDKTQTILFRQKQFCLLEIITHSIFYQDLDKGHVKIIFLLLIALSFPFFCPKLEQACTNSKNSIPDMLVIYLFEKGASKYLKMPFYVLESFPINCVMPMVILLKFSVTNW